MINAFDLKVLSYFRSENNDKHIRRNEFNIKVKKGKDAITWNDYYNELRF